MGPIFKGAAVVCLAALSGLQPAAGDLQFNVETADKGKHLLLGDAYTSLNLARVGHMSVRIGILTENSELAEGLKDAFTPAAYAAPANTCEGAIAELKKTKFTAKLTESGDQKYRQAVQKALEAGLNELQSYPDSEEKWREFWENADGANLAHLLWTNSTGVGCAVGTCTQGGDQNRTAGTSIAFLFCEMKPAAVENKAPFDKEYYEALTERKTPLTQMTEEDLKVPVQGGAAAAVPSLLVAGLTAIVAFASA
ncbi:SAG family member [Eimeria mitis]|uniref:SAG family member n=1 Tax=Eimeria mitis TaxID=44415 RepID=U6JN27_9EIME|nr:SAG family member [Eimeria mitis]CDJ26950.1 SAG family member [Eimeria mitis]